MKEIVTLFNCLPYTGGCASILPITSENFAVLFIAFIVAFFLLGIIIGYIINPHRRQNKTKDKPIIDTVKNESESPAGPGQDTAHNEAEQQIRNDSGIPRNGNYYNNYWDYSKPTRRY